MICVTINIEEIASSCHVTQIALNDDHHVVHPDTPFASKDEAERDARVRAERHLREHFNGDTDEIQWNATRVSSTEK